MAATLLAVASSACVGMAPGVKVHAFVDADSDAPIVASAPGPAFVERPITEGLGDLGLEFRVLEPGDEDPIQDRAAWRTDADTPQTSSADPELPTSLHARPGYDLGEGWKLGLWTGTDFMENGLGGFVAGEDVFDNWGVTDSMLTVSCAYGLGESTSLCGTAAAMRIQDMGLTSSLSDADLAWLVVGVQFQF
jgi:hypothetical protein